MTSAPDDDPNDPDAGRRPAGSPSGIRLGTVLGAPVILSPSWLLVAGIITLSYAPWAASRLPAGGPMAYVISFGIAVMLLLSVFLHELAHAAAGRAVGTPTQRIVLDVWGGHTAFDAEMTTPGASAFVGIVGPLTNGALAALAWLVLPAAEPFSVTEMMLQAALWSNAFVGVFNALPGLPLDGGRVLEALVWRVSGNRGLGTVAAGWIGRAVAVGLVLWQVVLPLANGGRPGTQFTVFTLLMAFMLWRGAGAALAVGKWRRRAPALSAEALRRPVIALPDTVSVADVTRALGQSGTTAAAVVLCDEAGRAAGVVVGEALRDVPVERHEVTSARAVSRALPPEALVRAELVGEPLLTHVQRHSGEPELVVVGPAGQPVGVLLWGDIAAALGVST